MDLSFDEKSYKEYLKEDEVSPNCKIREPNETFHDVLLSDDANLRKMPEGKKVIEILRAFVSNQ